MIEVNFKPRIDWGMIAHQLSAVPDVWVLVAEDVSTGTAARIRRRYGLEVRMDGVDSTTHRTAKLYARHNSDGSTSNTTAVDADTIAKHLTAALAAHIERHPESIHAVSVELLNLLEGGE